MWTSGTPRQFGAPYRKGETFCGEKGIPYGYEIGGQLGPILCEISGTKKKDALISAGFLPRGEIRRRHKSQMLSLESELDVYAIL